MNKQQWKYVWGFVRQNGLQGIGNYVPTNIMLYVTANRILIKRGY